MSAAAKTLQDIDPVHRHLNIYREVEEKFKMIFKHDELEPMLHRLNCLRLDSTVWLDSPSVGRSKFVANPEVEAKLLKVQVLASVVSTFVYKGRIILDELNHSANHRQFHDMKMILYRQAKLHRKANRPIPLSMFTPGTVVEYEVQHGTVRGPHRVTVAVVTSTELGYGVIETVEQRMRLGESVPHAFNTSHVTRIIQHVPGGVKFKKENDALKHYRDYERATDAKPRRSYLTYSGYTFLVRAMIDKVGMPVDPNQQFDTERLRYWTRTKCPGLKCANEDDAWARHYTQVPKKKLKRFVRQNMNRFLVSRHDQEAAERAEQRRQEREYERDMEWES